MSIRNLQHVFDPRSLAVIGASDHPGSVGAVTFANILAAGFQGPIYAVNPKHRSVAGHPAYKSVADLPTVPELAVVCTPAAAVPGIIQALAEHGCHAAVVLSAGLNAQDRSGRSLSQAMLDAARPALLRILGPNCLGLVVPGIGLNASFAPANALPGRVALVAQSGAILTAALDWANQRQIGFSRLVSLGEASDVDFGDMVDFLAADPHTDAILLYIESLTGARKFMSAARSAARAKPVIVMKSGRTPQAAQAAFSHTGSLAGADLVYDAAFRRAGALRVFDSAALFDAVSMLSQRRQPTGPRLAILTNGGGPGILAADAMGAGGGTLAELAPATRARLDSVLPPGWSHGNPVDIVGDAPAQRYLDALKVLVQSGDADAVMLIHAPTAIASSAEIARLLMPTLTGAGVPVLTVWMGGASVSEARRLCSAGGLPVFDTPESAVAGFLQMVHYRDNQKQSLQLAGAADVPATALGDARTLLEAHLAAGQLELDPAQSAALLRAYGIVVPDHAVVQNAAEAVAAAGRIGYPVVLKALAPGASHKSDVGGVALDLRDAQAVLRAAHEMQQRLAMAPGVGSLAGFMVQAMVRQRGASELIVGISTDAVFGTVLMFGHGGVDAELQADRAIALPPLNRALAADLVARTRVARHLAGFRDRPPVDLTALSDVLVAVSQMAVDLPELAEMDINPMLAGADGIVALDARIRLAPAGKGRMRHAHLAILPYPQHLVEQTVWREQPLCLRPVQPEDAAAHQAFFARLAPQDIHFRMFASMRELTAGQLARFTQIDYGREMAFIATRPDSQGQAETLGVARIVADPDNLVGEFAVIVRSDLKGQGLGRLLMDCLLRYCRANGLGQVSGTVLQENAAMLGLARRLGFNTAPGPDGTLLLRLELDKQTQGGSP
jgi:acetyltransferase